MSSSIPPPLQGRLTQRMCQSWRMSPSRCCLNPSRSCSMRATPACRAPWQQPICRRGGRPPSCSASSRLLTPHLSSCCNQQKAARSLGCSAMQGQLVDSACNTFPGLPMKHSCLQKLFRANHHTVRLQAAFQRTCGRQPVATSFSSALSTTSHVCGRKCRLIPLKHWLCKSGLRTPLWQSRPLQLQTGS